MGSDQGGTLQPIQEHSWDVTWNVPDPRGVQNTFFTLHPYSSLRELQTYFTFPPDQGVADVVSSKKSYDSPDKLVGGSPYEQIFQDQDSVIVLYDIPAGALASRTSTASSPKIWRRCSEDPSGWIFARGGDAYIACRPLQPYTWKPIEGGGRRLFSPYLKNGMVVQVAARSEYAGHGRVPAGDSGAAARDQTGCPLHPSASVRCAARCWSLPTAQTPRVNGAALDYAHWPLFGGPFVEAAVDSEQLILKYGKMRRTLDFRRLTVTDTP